MKDDETPGWLKAAQNGSIGEARTRAFLLDRFWVLERSVDIEGADFIIQRRLTRRTILDRVPPRLGVIQVKFFMTEGTSQYVHQDYIRDSDGNIHPEFFLLCHTGDEDNAKSYLVSAREIVDSFPMVDDDKIHAGKHRISGAQLLRSTAFLIGSKRRALDRIEHALDAADFSRNRSFMSWVLPSARLQEQAIQPIYREPIDNYWGDIPEAFLELKRKAQSALFDVEDAHQKLSDIVESTDPLKAFEILKELAYSCKSPHGWNVSLPSDMLDPDFRSVVSEHKEKVERLKAAGLLDAFIEFNATLKQQMAQQLAPAMPAPRASACVVQVRYVPESLADVRVTLTIRPVADVREGDSEMEPEDIQLIRHEKGRIEFWWLPGRYWLKDKTEDESWQHYIEHRFWPIYRPVMNTVYELHLPAA
ncbi:MAG: hypothetical protein ACREVV_09725 [Steroidobacteraceae bacterium]